MIQQRWIKSLFLEFWLKPNKAYILILVLFIQQALGLIETMFISRGSLLTRNLAELVKKEHFILDSEYLTTLLVVVPK